MPESDRCYYCDAPAEYLCDFVLASGAVYDEDFQRRCRENDPTLTNEDFLKAMLNPKDAAMKTCDRPLCEQHRVNRGHIFFCGQNGCEMVSQDFCPGHAQGPFHKPRYNPIGGPKCA